MIQNIKNIIKFAYFQQIGQSQTNTKHFKNHRPGKVHKYQQNNHNDLQQLCTLMKSQQRCQYWIVLAQNSKDNYLIKQQLYHSILQGTITVHNLFLLMIQCRVLPPDVWVPIEHLCKLKGDKDNQLCCLIHFTVMNQGQRHSKMENPAKWTKDKAERQLGPNFQSIYNSQIELQEKIAILPMLILLNQKNSAVLWSKLKWLDTFPYAIITNLHSNMKKIIEEGVSTTLMGNNDHFTTKMCIKSIQLLEIEGFVSVKNLFTFAYELYNISLLLSLLAGYEPAYDNCHHSFRLQLIDFTLQLFSCMELYEYELDTGKNNKDFAHLKQIIVNNKLYMEELNDIRFNQEMQDLISRLDENTKLSSQKEGPLHVKQELASENLQEWFFNNFRTFSQPNPRSLTNLNIAKFIPRTWSEIWATSDCDNVSHETSLEFGDDEDGESPLTPQKPEQKISRFRNQRQQTIIAHVLNQLYHLRTDYLELLHSMLANCYQRDEEPWSEVNSSFYRLQLYLMKNHLLQFLVYNFNSIETKNNPLTMISYYKIIGLMLRANPIAYGKLDRILLDIEQQMGGNQPLKKDKNSRQKNRSKVNSCRNNIIDSLSQSFVQNIALSKSTILMILSDQFEWKQNELQAYPNALYQSYFIKKVIIQHKIDWMVQVIEGICCIFLPNSQFPEAKRNQTENEIMEKQNQKFEWVTLLLTLYYYFEQTLQIAERRKRATNTGTTRLKSKQKQKISAPNKAFLDKILQSQKFMERLYSRRMEVAYRKKENGTLQLIPSEDCFHSVLSQSIVYRQERILKVLIEIMENWEQFYNNHSKKRIIEYSLSFPMLKIFKKKLKSRITGFMKAKQYQQKGEDFYFSYLKHDRFASRDP